MNKTNLTCINCPMGCRLTATYDENREVYEVTGNNCKMGEIYAKKEIKSPRRVVTSTVKIKDKQDLMVSVKTKEDIPKELIFEVMKEINKKTVTLPVHIGDVIVENVCNTGVDVVATCERK